MRFALHVVLRIALAICVLAPLSLRAEAPLLVVDGAVEDAPVAFDRADLEALPRAEFVTSTLWTEGETRFAGVRLADLLEAVGAEGEALTAYALNDYNVRIPASDAAADGPIIAYEMDGAAMSVRGKGPLWIVYPYDSASRFQTEEIYSRSIWQLTRITVHD